MLTGAAIVPVNLQLLSPEDPKQVLLPEKVGVLLEVGNLQQLSNGRPIVIEKQSEIARAIAQGVQEYATPNEGAS